MIDLHTAEILEYFNGRYKDVEKRAGDNFFKNFTSRMLLAIYSEMTFPGLPIEVDEVGVHVATSKLSESWFAYETLLPIIFKFGFEADKPEKIKSSVDVSSIQEAIALHRNFAVVGAPFGKASVFDDSRITDGYLQVLMEGAIDIFCGSIQSIVSTADSREKVQSYLLRLENNSKGVQEELLLLSYNAVTNSPSGVTSFHIMSIAYAVRNQYVHAGEIPVSGIEDLNVKAALLSACFTFVSQYALIVATQLMDHALSNSI